MPSVLPVLVKQQDRAKQTGKLSFHNEHQVFQYFFQRSVARYHLQNATLAVAQDLCALAIRYIRNGPDKFDVPRSLPFQDGPRSSRI